LEVGNSNQVVEVKHHGLDGPRIRILLEEGQVLSVRSWEANAVRVVEASAFARSY
jgi:hypothetical protein